MVFHTGVEGRGKNAMKQACFDQLTFTGLPNNTVLLF